MTVSPASLPFAIFETVHQRHYQRPVSLWWWVLTALPTLFYHAGLKLRNWAYQTRLKKTAYLPVPVISIGNLTTGGTGKTPAIIAIARLLHESLGLKVGILNRGYGAPNPQRYHRATHPDFGDEAYMIQQACPEAVVIVGRDRRANALRLLQEHEIDVILLDDGFQHFPLARDLNLLLVDDAARFGNEKLLPMGPLREPIASIRRADCVLMTRPNNPEASLHDLEKLIQTQKAHKTRAGVILQQFCGLRALETDEAQPPEWINGQRVLAFSGIGNPAQFAAMLREAGADVVETFTLADHAGLDVALLARLQARWLALGKPRLICTRKDAVKLYPEALGEMRAACYIAEMEMQLPDLLVNLIQRYVTAREAGRQPLPALAEAVPERETPETLEARSNV